MHIKKDTTEKRVIKAPNEIYVGEEAILNNLEDVKAPINK